MRDLDPAALPKGAEAFEVLPFPLLRESAWRPSPTRMPWKLVTQKEDPPFTRNEGWSIRVAGVDTMGHGPRR